MEKTKIKISIRIHPGYKEFEEMKKQGLGNLQMLGKYQYIYSLENKKISLVQFKNYREEGDNFWEIYCLEGKLFEDTERFGTKIEAQTRIVKLLK